jgi:hypothetical protein
VTPIPHDDVGASKGQSVSGESAPAQRADARNSLRRVLLSSLQRAAVTAIRIEGVRHEFSSLAGVREDVTDIVLNVKQAALGPGGSADPPMVAEGGSGYTDAPAARKREKETKCPNASNAIASPGPRTRSASCICSPAREWR